MVQLPQHAEGTMLTTAPLRDESHCFHRKTIFSTGYKSPHIHLSSLPHKTKLFLRIWGLHCTSWPLLSSQECSWGMDPNHIWGHHGWNRDPNSGAKSTAALWASSPLFQGSRRAHSVLWGEALAFASWLHKQVKEDLSCTTKIVISTIKNKQASFSTLHGAHLSRFKHWAAQSHTYFTEFLHPAPVSHPSAPSSQHCLQAALGAQLPGMPLLMDAAQPSEAAAQQLWN